MKWKPVDLDRPCKRFVIAAGILVRDGCVLLVENQWGDKIEWTLPGGVVEPEESVMDALQREFREETSLEMVECGRLAYVLQNQVTSRREEGLVLAFQVRSARGELAVVNDEYVRGARFVPIAELQCTLPNPVHLLPLERFLEAPAQRTRFYGFDDCDGEVQLRFMT